MSNEARQYLAQRRTAYQLTFAGPHGESVLDDLAKFCRAKETTFHENDRVQALMEGRREVWLRIAQHLNMTEEQLWKKIGEGK